MVKKFLNCNFYMIESSFLQSQVYDMLSTIFLKQPCWRLRLSRFLEIFQKNVQILLHTAVYGSLSTLTVFTFCNIQLRYSTLKEFYDFLCSNIIMQYV